MNDKLRVGIDGRALQGKLTGVGHYVKNLLLHLPHHLPDAEFFIYTNKDLPHFQVPGFQIVQEQRPLWRKLPAVGWLKVAASSLLHRDRIDVFWGTVSFLPPTPIPTLLTVYDLNYRIVPETMTRSHQLAHALWFVKDVQRANKVFSISQGTLGRLQETTGRGSDEVVYPAADHMKFDPSQVPRMREKYQLDFPYLLAVATWEPRKNLELLVQTLMDLKAKGAIPDHRLVLVGGRGWKDERIAALVKEVGDHLIPLGYVPEEDLPGIYGGAELFVFPSRYEGFGMPVLEARLCGTRVVASDLPELREAGQEGAFYVKPDLVSLGAGIVHALEQERPAPLQVSPYTWDAGARQLAKLLTKTASEGRRNHG